MKKALDKAHEGIKKGESPFGSCIVKDGKVIAVAHNTVLSENDPTNHAEINAIRKACKNLGHHDLSGCIIYSTAEPCPMCFAAIHWAKIGRIIFGTGISDVKNLGFSELTISNEEMRDKGGSKVEVIGDFMRDECLELLGNWKQKGGEIY
ncbi:TPA: nucleoside deaminase [Candidatus Micrarchaeota archaeon]|nr:nucleoside deaminase [Candidatus Micrarchaeota archaeon]